MNKTLRTLPLLAGLLLAGCAEQAPKPEAAAAPATPLHDAVKLSPQDRAAFFVHAARTGDLAAVRAELDAGLDPAVRDNIGQTALIAAVGQSRLDVIKLLIERKAPVDEADGAGWTPLHHATYFSDGASLLKLLLDAGANINARNDRGITPLYFATAFAHEPQVRYLLERKADRELASSTGFTPLKVAQTKGYESLVALLDPSAAAAAAKPAPTRP